MKEEDLTKVLGNYLGIPAVCQNRNDVRPEYPYLAWSLISAMAAPKGSVCEEKGEKYWQSRQKWSFTVCANEADEARLLAEKAMDWFCMTGKNTLEGLGYAAEKVGEMQNRDTFMTADFERREGFEVELAMMKQVCGKEEGGWIEEAEITMREEFGRDADVQ